MLFAFGCTEKLTEEFVIENKTEPIEENIEKSDNHVTKQQAIEVANMFLETQVDSKFRSGVSMRSKASVEAVNSKQNNDPLMYIINYPEGGWAIVSATKAYYPILAYSDENSFMQNPDVEAVSNWITETIDAISASESLNDSTKIEILNMWNTYTTESEQIQNVVNTKSSSSMAEARSKRLTELGSQYGYGSSAYRIIPLIGARSYISSDSEWQSICNWAQAQGSPPEFTIFVARNDYHSQEVGPLLKTKWHQNAPFNDRTPHNRAAGCGPVAVAQVMKYYDYPQSITYSYKTINLSNIPNFAPAGSNNGHSELLAFVGEKLSTNYSVIGTWVTPGSMTDGIKRIGFTVTRSDHNQEKVKAQLFTFKRPVVMLGADNNLIDPLTYIGNSHYWVCDGAREFGQTYSYYLELINPSNNTYYTHPYVYNPSNLFKTHLYNYIYFCMNWGWGGNYDGWYLCSNIATPNGDYRYAQQDYYISKP